MIDLERTHAALDTIPSQSIIALVGVNRFLAMMRANSFACRSRTAQACARFGPSSRFYPLDDRASAEFHAVFRALLCCFEPNDAHEGYYLVCSSDKDGQIMRRKASLKPRWQHQLHPASSAPPRRAYRELLLQALRRITLKESLARLHARAPANLRGLLTPGRLSAPGLRPPHASATLEIRSAPRRTPQSDVTIAKT